jgi:DNA polymerase
MGTLHIDFETRSAVDLRLAGVGVYARDKSTSVLCIAWAIDDGEVQIWRHTDDAKALEPLATAVSTCEDIVAHNAAFELAIWNHNFKHAYKMPYLDVNKMRCTMAQAYAMGLPGNLEGAAAAMGLDVRKDLVGGRVMRQLAKPRDILPDGTIVWWDKPERYEQLYDYCIQDVKVERELDKRLLRLSPEELELWRLDQRINNRGIMVDMKAVKAANEIVGFESSRLDAEMKTVTGNFVACCTEVSRIKEWLKVSGIEVDSLSKDKVAELLKGDLTPEQRRVLELRKEAGKTSTAKLVAFLNRAEEDGRIRGILQYHAAHTGRWGGRGIQPQNFPRPGISQHEIEAVFTILDSDQGIQQKIELIDMFHGSPTEMISHILRGFLIAKPGHEFIGADYSAIEGRVLAWLCGEEKILELYRGGQDVYKWNAMSIFGLNSVEEVTDGQRFVGKVAELALGYGGGKGAFKVMSQGYGLEVNDDESERIKGAWRDNRPCTVRYWRELEQSALTATLNPGRTFKAGPGNRGVKFLKSGSFLFCQLPSQRVLTYPYPKVETITTPWGDEKDGLTYMTVNSYSRKWTREKTYGGKLSENVTQAVARDLLAHSLFEFEKEDIPVVMHVHDEVLTEVPIGQYDVSTIESIAASTPAWAKDLPVEASGWKGNRYQK